jgi:hypothetical protein
MYRPRGVPYLIYKDRSTKDRLCIPSTNGLSASAVYQMPGYEKKRSAYTTPILLNSLNLLVCRCVVKP